MYHEVTESLRRSYGAAVELRDASDVPEWKDGERVRFLELLRRETRSSLLEVGAGTGVHGKFFQDNGIDVCSTDLSPEMVRCCRDKGLEAYALDFLRLPELGSLYEAAFAMNCLLHVPRDDLSSVIRTIASMLVPGGLFYLGQYGGRNEERVWLEDTYEPKRFFSYLTDEDIQMEAGAVFDLLDFRVVEIGARGELHFQSLTLRKRFDH